MTEKRDIFAELMEGMDALAAEKTGKITLKTVEIELPKQAPVFTQFTDADAELVARLLNGSEK